MGYKLRHRRMVGMLAVSVSCPAYKGWILKLLERLSDRVEYGVVRAWMLGTARGERQTARLRGQKKAKVKGVTAGQPAGEGAESRNILAQ